MKQIIIKTFLCIVVALSSLTVNAQVKAFEKYADTKNVTYVYISKYMLAMAGKNATPSVPGIDTKTLAGKLTGIQIITSEDNAAQKKLKSDVKSIMAKDKYELLMQMNEDDSKVNIFHHVDKQQSAVIMQVEGNDETTVMIFSGKFTLDDVMKMTQ
jgi:thioredoxin-related protein